MWSFSRRYRISNKEGTERLKNIEKQTLNPSPPEGIRQTRTSRIRDLTRDQPPFVERRESYPSTVDLFFFLYLGGVSASTVVKILLSPRDPGVDSLYLP